MSYELHDFQSGQRLYASQLNEMDAKIAEIDSAMGAEVTEYGANDICVLNGMRAGKEIGIESESTSVYHTGKNLFKVFGRENQIVSGWGAGNPRPFDENKFVRGFSSAGFQDGASVCLFEYTDTGFILPNVSGGGGGHGVLFPIRLPEGKRFTMSLDCTHEVRIMWFDYADIFIRTTALINPNAEYRHMSATFEVPEGVKWVGVLFQNTNDRTCIYDNIQIEYDTTESEYSDYVGKKYNGVSSLTAYNGTNLIWAFSDFKTVIARDDSEVVIAELEERIDGIDAVIEPLHNTVINRNLDVLPCVHAATSYGIHSGGAENNKRTVGIAVTTDIHKSDLMLNNAIDYINEYPFIDFGINLGDTAAGNYAETDGTWYHDIVNRSKKPFYTVIGNHDGGNSKDASISATVQNQFDKWILPNRAKMGMPALDKTYYAIHDATYGISIIVLNTYDVPDDKDTSGNYVVSRGQNGYSQAQINWFVNELANVPTENHLIVAQHMYTGQTAKQDSIWSQKWSGIANESSYGDMIAEIVNAWINGTAFTKTYTTTISGLPSITVSADYSSRGTGVFVAHIVGHVHSDYYSKSKVFTNQNIVAFVCTADGKWQGGDNDLPRVVGTKSHDAFTILSVNKQRRTLNLVRIGSNKTLSMVDRTMVAIPY